MKKTTQDLAIAILVFAVRSAKGEEKGGEVNASTAACCQPIAQYLPS